MTYSPKPYSSTDSLRTDYKYFDTVRMLGELALVSKNVANLDNPLTVSVAIYKLFLKEAEEKVFAVYDGYCLEGYEPQLFLSLNSGDKIMSWLEYYTRQIKLAMAEISEELARRGKE